MQPVHFIKVKLLIKHLLYATTGQNEAASSRFRPQTLSEIVQCKTNTRIQTSPREYQRFLIKLGRDFYKTLNIYDFFFFVHFEKSPSFQDFPELSSPTSQCSMVQNNLQ